MAYFLVSGGALNSTHSLTWGTACIYYYSVSSITGKLHYCTLRVEK